MELREYVDARWYALVRAAVDLGVPEEDAPEVVRQVLDREQRRIKRAEDPDPLVHQALRDAVLGAPSPGRRGWRRLAGLAAVLAAVGVVVALTRPDPPPTDHLGSHQVPSLFGYDGPAASRLLRSRGLDVRLQPFRSCEVMDRVVASDPPAGTPYDDGDPITVYTALPADVACLTDYQDRATAWGLLDFANGRGTAPEFASRVFVYPGDGVPLVLTREQAAERGSWRDTGILDALRTASSQVALVDEHPVSYAVPAIRITDAADGLGACGVPPTAVAGDGDTFTLLVRSPKRTGCPLRLDVYRDDDRIEAVAFYPSR
jgi:hypothetical protein